MGMEDMEKKMKSLYRHVRTGRVTEEIAEEMSEFIDKVEEMGDSVKGNFTSMIDEMKKALKKMK